MRREGRLSGKPSNKSRKIGGRGVTGEVRCCCSSSSSSSHKKKNHTLIPVSKSQSKVKGRRKRSAYDVTFNHLLEDWRVCSSSRSSFIAPHSRTARKPSPASQSLWDSDTDQSSGEVCDPCENDEDAGKLQQEQQEEEGKDEVSAMAIMIDTALQNMRNRKRKPEAVACFLTENHEEARREEEVDASGDNQAEIPDCYKAACNNNELQFGSFFKNEMIVASSQQHKNRARSEDSWSEIELSEPDIMSQESWEEDEES